ncbi:MAG: helix-hairpin-helix domain-containing protein [Bacteroidaceae bacterium]
MFTGWFYFARSDRRGQLLILVVLVVVIALALFLPEEESSKPLSLDKKGTKVDSFLSHLKESKSKAWAHPVKHPKEHAVLLQRFNPNTADTTLLLSLGLKPWIVRNVMRYRRAGGTFRKASDFARIYGLHPKDFERLEPYINLPSKSEITTESSVKPKTFATVNKKFTELVKLNLNGTDTTQLKRIPGIGSYYARRIQTYGEQLGGYVSVSQLLEIDGLPKGVEQWFCMNSIEVKKLSVNKATFKQLLHHPYLSYPQVVAISKLKWKQGAIKSLRELEMLSVFTQTDIERLQPYLSF